MASNPIKLGIVGVGKIVRDQHLPALAKDSNYKLVAAASRHGKVDGIPNYPSIEAMLAAEPGLEAVSLCMPPQFRHDAARAALEAKKHVFLEKPPGATVSEVEGLKNLARENGVSLFASWHSRYAPAVEAARAFLASARIETAAIIWKEDVRRWHPNQEWIWEPGGFGVFDPGINALSIATYILPPMFITSAVLDFPENRASPVAAHVVFRTSAGVPVTMELDWLQTGPQSWDIVAETDKGRMELSSGGAKLAIDGRPLQDEPEAEYPMLYRRFAEIVRAGISDVDLAPLQHVADAFMLGKRNVVEAFFD
ncbi:MAG: galactose 1-dehydrogenase [Mesorhizobium sp. SCN 65-12]|nr:MAG: galactose 1-dehydrogenase [Mesorhizobium sp. SCN 65-12]